MRALLVATLLPSIYVMPPVFVAVATGGTHHRVRTRLKNVWDTLEMRGARI